MVRLLYRESESAQIFISHLSQAHVWSVFWVRVRNEFSAPWQKIRGDILGSAVLYYLKGSRIYLWDVPMNGISRWRPIFRKYCRFLIVRQSGYYTESLRVQKLYLTPESSTRAISNSMFAFSTSSEILWRLFLGWPVFDAALPWSSKTHWKYTKTYIWKKSTILSFD